MLNSAARQVQQWLEAHSRLYLVVCGGLCFISFSGYSHAKAPWVDEILQLTVARLGTSHGIWNAVKSGIVAEPPVLSLGQHYLIRTFGESMFLMRLPAILGFTVGCVSLAYLAQRYVSAIFAASTFFMPYATGIRWRAIDARPYGIMFGSTALALLCWDRMGREGAYRNAWRVGFVLSLAALNSTHFYSILVLLPLALGEITRWAQKRRIEWATAVCVAIGSIPYIIWLPILTSVSREYLTGFCFRVTFENLYTFYDSTVLSLPFVGILGLILISVPLRGSPVAPITSESSALWAPASVCIGFLLIPVVGFLAGLLITGVFVPYHYMITAVGIALGVPLALAAICGDDRMIGLALFLALAGHGLFITVRGLSGYIRHEAPYPTLAEVRKSIPELHPDIVVPSPFEFLPFQEATRADPQNNLMYLYDAAKARQLLQVDTPELIARHLRGITSARIESFDGYVADHHRFYIVVTDDPKGVWLNTYLSRDMAASFAWLGTIGRFQLYRIELSGSSRAR